MPNPYQYSGNGEGFLTDYSGLATAGGAFQGFTEAFQNAQDRQMKRQETQAQIEAVKAKMQREAEQTKIESYKNHMQIDPDGTVTERPMSDFETQQMNLKQLHEQNIANMAGKRLDMQGQRLDLQKQRFGETQSQNAASAGKTLQDDSLVKEFEKSRANLARGKSLLTGTTPLTYNNMNAVQQDIISALSSGGVSSEGKVSREMQESYRGRWNNLLAKMGQYGADNDIRQQDPGLAKQVLSLLNEVDGAVAKNLLARKQKLAGAYTQHSNKKVQATVKQQIDDAQNGLVQPEEGLVNPGLVNGGDVDAKVKRLQELRAKKAAAAAGG